MTTPAKPLKAQNVTWIWGVVVADTLTLLGFAYPAAFDQTTLPVAALLRLCAAALAPVVVLLLTSLLPSEAKAVLVFWRARNTLPGHRAFSLYAARDARIDLQALRKNIGEFPDAPRDQNTLWYRLYKKVETEAMVTLAHRHYLLFRDLAALSLLLTVIAPVVVFALGAATAAIWFTICLFAIQYLATAVAARNHGVRLVTNVLALHSSKRRA